MVFPVIARRLLGVRVGIIRTLLTGAVAVAGMTLFSSVMQSPDQGGLLVGVQMGCALLLAMGFLAGLEMLAPGGAGSPAGWLRAVRARTARARRYSQISAIAVRHGLRPYLLGRQRRGEDLHEGATGTARLARPLRLALEEAGPTFIKLGQVLSTRHDLLPPAFIRELSRLQNQVPPESPGRLADQLRTHFGKPTEDVFATFDHEPLAAASIAQVHLAELHSGEQVVVKVQRPGVRTAVHRDLDIVCRIASVLEARARWARALGLVDLANGFATSVREELDFRVEARNMATVKAAWERRRADDDVVIPRTYEALSGELVLVLERLPGSPISALPGHVANPGAQGTDVARALLGSLLKQVLVDGTFHADPHPGNILLLEDGRVALIDFGSVGRLDGQIRAALSRFLIAVHHSDPAALCDALLDLVSRPEEIDEQALERSLGRFMARHLTPGAAPDVMVFVDLFRLISLHGLGIPPEVAAVFRALATLEGTLTSLSPGFDIMTESQKWAEEQGASQVGYSSAGSSLESELLSAVSTLRRLPRRVDRVTSALEEGRLGVNIRMFADSRDRRYIRGLVHEILLTGLAATAGLMAVILLHTTGGPMVTPSISLFRAIGYHMLVFSGVLSLRMLFVIFRTQR
ncbi:ABC1 kinase family protein [Streptomyces cinnamoneus]|uniref:ABC1 kinase family protein n=1 Tax=Streptomyces cinnamoneus TaxID=53446 RepID=UPI001E42048B|nr:AarF/UbiB family protein [Streptomyces cinnamoneus]